MNADDDALANEDLLIEKALAILQPPIDMKVVCRSRLRRAVSLWAEWPTEKVANPANARKQIAKIAELASKMVTALPANDSAVGIVMTRGAEARRNSKLRIRRDQQIAETLVKLLRNGTLSVLVRQLSTLTQQLADQIGDAITSGPRKSRAREFVWEVAIIANRYACEEAARPSDRFVDALNLLRAAAFTRNPQVGTADLRDLAIELLPPVRQRRETVRMDEPLQRKLQLWRESRGILPMQRNVTPRTERGHRTKAAKRKAKVGN